MCGWSDGEPEGVRLNPRDHKIGQLREHEPEALTLCLPPLAKESF